MVNWAFGVQPLYNFPSFQILSYKLQMDFITSVAHCTGTQFTGCSFQRALFPASDWDDNSSCIEITAVYWYFSNKYNLDLHLTADSWTSWTQSQTITTQKNMMNCCSFEFDETFWQFEFANAQFPLNEKFKITFWPKWKMFTQVL